MSEAGPEAFVADLLPAIRQASAIARALEGQVRNEPKSGEDSPVKAALTVADTAAQEALLVPLLSRFADVRLEAEEDTESVQRFTGGRDAQVVIDPIDGTLRSYLRGEGPYAVMAGLAIAGRYRAALVGLPREGWTVHAAEGGGAFLAEGDASPEPVRAARDGEDLLVSYNLPAPAVACLEARGYRVRGACGGAIAVAPVLPGVAGGLRLPHPPPLSPRGRIGLLVSAEAGARVATRDGPAGPDLEAAMPHVAVAADDEVLADLLDALDPA